jgi:dolichol kinase
MIGAAKSENTRQWIHALLGFPALILASGAISWVWFALGILGALVLHNFSRLPIPGIWNLVRSHEKPWKDGPSHYAYGVLAALCILPIVPAACGWLALAWGDALSNGVGRRLPILILRPSRSLGGCLGMALGTATSVAVVFLSAGLQIPGPWMLLMLGLSAAILELVVVGIDDNLLLPIGVGLVTLLLLGT